VPPRGLTRGFSLLDLSTVVVLVALFAATVVVLQSPRAYNVHREVECLNNVRNLVGLLEITGGDYPRRGGANLILTLVERRDLEGADFLEILFCPGDRRETFERAGGVAAYEALDLSRHDHGHLTSYAGRDMEDARWRLRRAERVDGEALIADDSEDHHHGRGYVVGYTGGAVRWREKVEDWGLDADTPAPVGPGSPARELRCLRPD
jgi:hypothetical protein